MTSWMISWGRSRGVKWHIVDFIGPSGGQSRGVVDLLAVRKNHNAYDDVVKRGDLLDIVLIQVKGGSAPEAKGGGLSQELLPEQPHL